MATIMKILWRAFNDHEIVSTLDHNVWWIFLIQLKLKIKFKTNIWKIHQLNLIPSVTWFDKDSLIDVIDANPVAEWCANIAVRTLQCELFAAGSTAFLGPDALSKVSVRKDAFSKDALSQMMIVVVKWEVMWKVKSSPQDAQTSTPNAYVFRLLCV